MKESFRRVSSTLGVLGLLAFSFVTINQISQICSSGQVSCLSAAVTFGVTQPSSMPVIELEMRHAAPTSIESSDNIPSIASLVFTLVQVTAVYMILLSVIMLVLLELTELRYLRKLLKMKTSH
jgi:hypothetical protein